MIGDLKPYSAYKDSGVPWIGEVPEHWEVQPLGRIGSLFKGNGGNKDDEVASGIPCVRYGDLYTKHEFFIRTTKAYVTEERAIAYTPIRYGDVLFAASGETAEEIGKSAVNLIYRDARCGGDVLVLRPTRDVIPEFLGYAADSVASRHQKACMGRGFTVIHIYNSQLKRLTLPLPPPPEQAAIATFLDYADRRIRQYIRSKQKLIKLLEEHKKAIIQHAVTSGIDPSVRLKPSGVKWLGDIPEHWSIWRSKRLFSPSKELARPDDIQLSATQAYGVIPQDEYERRIGRKVTKIFRHLDKRRHVEIGDFVISMRSFQGGLERAWAQGCIRSSYIVLKPSEQVDIDFFSYVFKSHSYIGALQSTANFIRDGQDLNFDNFCAVDLALPPIEEQRAIAQALNTIISSTLESTERARNEIAFLRELRTRLIADVVTGKLDVREAAANLPQNLDETDLAEEDLLEEDSALEDDGDLDDAVEEEAA